MSTHQIYKSSSKYVDTIHTVKTVPQLQRLTLLCTAQSVCATSGHMHDAPQRRRHGSWDVHSLDEVDVATCARLTTNDACTYRRRSLRDGIVTVRQRVHAVVQYIPLVVEGAQAQLVYFDGVNYVIGRSKYLEF